MNKNVIRRVHRALYYFDYVWFVGIVLGISVGMKMYPSRDVMRFLMFLFLAMFLAMGAVSLTRGITGLWIGEYYGTTRYGNWLVWWKAGRFHWNKEYGRAQIIKGNSGRYYNKTMVVIGALELVLVGYFFAQSIV